MPELRDYQKEVIEKIHTGFKNHNSLLLQMP